MTSPILITILLLGITHVSLVSCSSYQNITKTNEPTIEDFKTKIVIDRDYAFTLRSGKKLYIHITKIDSVNVYGVARDSKEKNTSTYIFEDSYEGLHKNVSKIDLLKFDSILTIIIPTIFIGIGVIKLIDYVSHPF